MFTVLTVGSRGWDGDTKHAVSRPKPLLHEFHGHVASLVGAASAARGISVGSGAILRPSRLKSLLPGINMLDLQHRIFRRDGVLDMTPTADFSIAAAAAPTRGPRLTVVRGDGVRHARRE